MDEHQTETIVNKIPDTQTASAKTSVTSTSPRIITQCWQLCSAKSLAG